MAMRASDATVRLLDQDLGDEPALLVGQERPFARVDRRDEAVRAAGDAEVDGAAQRLDVDAVILGERRRRDRIDAAERNAHRIASSAGRGRWSARAPAAVRRPLELDQ
jgi:hypothetical protein